MFAANGLSPSEIVPVPACPPTLSGLPLIENSKFVSSFGVVELSSKTSVIVVLPVTTPRSPLGAAGTASAASVRQVKSASADSTRCMEEKAGRKTGMGTLSRSVEGAKGRGAANGASL